MAEISDNHYPERPEPDSDIFTFPQKQLYEYMRELYAARSPYARHVLPDAHCEVKIELAELRLDSEWRLQQALRQLPEPIELAPIDGVYWDPADFNNN
jgi:hypothetical protein